MRGIIDGFGGNFRLGFARQVRLDPVELGRIAGRQMHHCHPDPAPIVEQLRETIALDFRPTELMPQQPFRQLFVEILPLLMGFRNGSLIINLSCHLVVPTCLHPFFATDFTDWRRFF